MKDHSDNKKSFIGNLVEKLDMEDGLKDPSLLDTQKLKKLSMEPPYLKDRKRLKDTGPTKGDRREDVDPARRKKPRPGPEKSSVGQAAQSAGYTNEQRADRLRRDPGPRPKRKKKKILVAVISLLVLLGGAYLVFQASQLNRPSLVEDFHQALAQEDLAYLREHLTYRGQEMTETDFQAYVDLVLEEGPYQEELLDQLEDLKKDQADSQSYFEASYPWQGWGREMILDIKPIRIENPQGLTVLNDEKPSAEEFEILPGRYRVQKTVEFLILEQSQDLYGPDQVYHLDLDLAEAEVANDSISLASTSRATRIVSSDEALVFINDLYSGMTVKEFNEGSFQPREGELVAVVEFLPWTIAFSDKVEYRGEKRIDLAPHYDNDETLGLLTQLILSTLKDDSLAFREQNADVLEHLTGEALESTKAWLKMNQEYKIIYLRDYQALALDFGSFDLTKKGTSYQAYLGGFLDYREAKYNPDTQEEPRDDAYRNYEGVRRGFHMLYDEEAREWKTELWGTTYRLLSRERAQEIDME